MNIKLKQFLVQPKSKKHKKNDSESEKATSDSLSTGLLERISPRDRSDTTNGDTRGALISEETMEVGSIKWSVYGSLLRHFGVFTAIISLLGFTLYRVGDIFSTMWLSEWSNDGLNLQKRINESQGGVTESPEIVSGKVRELAVHRIAVYLAIGGGEAAAVMIGALAMAVGCLSASTTLHNEMLWAIIRTPMSFFDVTPLGRIINRFGKDIDVLDLELYIHLDGWLDAAFQTAATLLLTCYEIPFFSIVAAPICLAFFVIQKVYMAASRQFRRMQSTTRSPVLNNFSETLHGASSIRAYKAEKHFIEKCQIRIDLNQNCYFHAMITPGEAGMVLSYALTICDAISWMIRVATEVENAVVAAERVDEYANVQSEAPWIRKDGPDLDQDWPQQGDVSLVDYSTRYREGMELVLKDINLDVRSGQKVGIVGRTGAGKSSLTLALFRIIEPSYGRIVIDDIDIALLGLHELRSRLTMIPQDPVLFRGNVRTNIDPYNIYTDEQLYTAIERAHLNKEIFLLDYEITHGGTNLSVGERQLLCLARALLRKSKIILLDEATAAVDMETDALIQETIRRDFSSCTIITIAHRLNTVLDYDVIVVLREGRIIEKGSPKQLLADKQSEFHSMAQDAGWVPFP
uniref:ABCD3 n=1 Tax=Dermanyssus gallinae TaxID=34641 RepID=A0AA51BVG8_9ACAR|nr:ABCD3 [Dermanyssus gallinae]